MIDTFINAIFLYDDKMVITFNYKDGTDTITFDDLKTALDKEKAGSDLDCSTAPVFLQGGQAIPAVFVPLGPKPATGAVGSLYGGTRGWMMRSGM